MSSNLRCHGTTCADPGRGSRSRSRNVAVGETFTFLAALLVGFFGTHILTSVREGGGLISSWARMLYGAQRSSLSSSSPQSSSSRSCSPRLSAPSFADHDPDSTGIPWKRVFPKLGETAISAEIIDRGLRGPDRATRRP